MAETGVRDTTDISITQVDPAKPSAMVPNTKYSNMLRTAGNRSNSGAEETRASSVVATAPLRRDPMERSSPQEDGHAGVATPGRPPNDCVPILSSSFPGVLMPQVDERTVPIAESIGGEGGHSFVPPKDARRGDIFKADVWAVPLALFSSNLYFALKGPGRVSDYTPGEEGGAGQQKRVGVEMGKDEGGGVDCEEPTSRRYDRKTKLL